MSGLVLEWSNAFYALGRWYFAICSAPGEPHREGKMVSIAHTLKGAGKAPSVTSASKPVCSENGRRFFACRLTAPRFCGKLFPGKRAGEGTIKGERLLCRQS